MRIERRRFLHLAAAGATALGAMPRSADADTLPTRPIRLVLPFPPGRVFDIIGGPGPKKSAGRSVRSSSKISPAPAGRLLPRLSRTPRPTATPSFSAAPRSISPT